MHHASHLSNYQKLTAMPWRYEQNVRNPATETRITTCRVQTTVRTLQPAILQAGAELIGTGLDVTCIEVCQGALVSGATAIGTFPRNLASPPLLQGRPLAGTIFPPTHPAESLRAVGGLLRTRGTRSRRRDRATARATVPWAYHGATPLHDRRPTITRPRERPAALRACARLIDRRAAPLNEDPSGASEPRPLLAQNSKRPRRPSLP